MAAATSRDTLGEAEPGPLTEASSVAAFRVSVCAWLRLRPATFIATRSVFMSRVNGIPALAGVLM